MALENRWCRTIKEVFMGEEEYLVYKIKCLQTTIQAKLFRTIRESFILYAYTVIQSQSQHLQSSRHNSNPSTYTI